MVTIMQLYLYMHYMDILCENNSWEKAGKVKVTVVIRALLEELKHQVMTDHQEEKYICTKSWQGLDGT